MSDCSGAEPQSSCFLRSHASIWLPQCLHGSLAAIGALNARKGAKLKLARSEEIHEVSRGFTFWFTLERDIQIRRRSERVQQCPKREALTQVRCQTEIDLHVLDAGIERFLRD